MRRIEIVDATLCAAQYALWRGAALADAIPSCLGRLDGAGFSALDVMDGPLFEFFILHGQNPWRYMERAVGSVSRTPLNAWISARALFGRQSLSEEMLSRGIELTKRVGIGRLTCYDALNGAQQMNLIGEMVQAAGLHRCAAVVFTNIRGDAITVLPALVRNIVSNFDSVCLWDPAGAMNLEIARDLLPLLRQACGDVPFELRIHCQSGRAEAICLEAVEHGVQILHTAVNTLAGGPSLPSFEYMAEHLGAGLAHTDQEKPKGISEHLLGFAERSGLPIGAHRLADLDAPRFEIPSDLIADMDNAACGVVERDSLCEAMRSIRMAVPDVTMVHPAGKIILRHAVSSFTEGRFGATTNSDLGQAVLIELCSAVIGSGSTLTDNSGADDECRLIEAMFVSLSRSPLGMQIEQHPRIRADTPLTLLLDELARRPRVREIHLRKSSWQFKLGS